MFCQNCGNELREGAAFCQNCGQPIRETANVRSERPNAPAYIPPQQTQTGYFTPGQGQSGAVYPEAASTQKPKKKGHWRTSSKNTPTIFTPCCRHPVWRDSKYNVYRIDDRRRRAVLRMYTRSIPARCVIDEIK